MSRLPGDHIDYKPYLRLRHLPVDDMANTLLVVKHEFGKIPA